MKVHYFPASGFSVRLPLLQCMRPTFRFSDSPHRAEDLPRAEAARLIRAARRIVRQSYSKP